jgi:hypothetical protein
VLWKVACYENNRCDVGWCVPHYNAPPCTWIESSVAKLCSTSQEYGTLKYYHLDEHCDCLQTMDSILSHVGLSFGIVAEEYELLDESSKYRKHVVLLHD